MDSEKPLFEADAEQYIANQPKGNNVAKGVKYTAKYLATCNNPQAYRAVVRAAPDSAIRAICNAALNVERGDVIQLSPKQKALFRKYRKHIAILTSNASIKRKRSTLQSQKGGFFFIPPLILAALGALGSGALGAVGGAIATKVMGKE